MPQIMTITDDEIVVLLQNPATIERGFRLLMQVYQERLYRQVWRILGNHEDVNDVLQDALVRIYRHIGNFKAEAKLYTWLYRIVTNEAITFLNKKKKTNLISFDDDSKTNWEEVLGADTLLEESHDILEKLEKGIALLPEKQRLVFQMRYYDEMSYKDISSVLGTSEGGLKASFHHALKKVEEFLKR
jgi:RNA polymerase sigma-70 factor (ECF subfamily)